jgi:hypothetical protein
MKKKNYTNIKLLLIGLPLTFVTLMVFAEDYYRIWTINEGVVQKSGNDIDSVKIEGNTINFYQADVPVYTNLLANVDSITLERQSIFEDYNLISRVVESMLITDNGQSITLTLSPVNEASRMQYTTLRYTDNTEKSLRIENNTNTVVIPGLKTGTPYTLTSTFIFPAELGGTSVDAIPPDLTVPEELKVSFVGWTVLASSPYESYWGVPANIIDGNTETFWHSATNAPFPHWLIIDMGSVIENCMLSKIEAYRTHLWWYGDTKTIQFFMGEDPNPNGDWVKVAEGKFSADVSTVAVKTIINIPNGGVDIGQGRYLKVVLPDNNREDGGTLVSLAEFYFYGYTKN